MPLSIIQVASPYAVERQVREERERDLAEIKECEARADRSVQAGQAQHDWEFEHWARDEWLERREARRRLLVDDYFLEWRRHWELSAKGNPYIREDVDNEEEPAYHATAFRSAWGGWKVFTTAWKGEPHQGGPFASLVEAQRYAFDQLIP